MNADAASPSGGLAMVWAVVAEEFSDVRDGAEAVRIVLRLGLALVLGFALGYEREVRGKDAGVRTHMLVALGSALFVLLPGLMGMDTGDLSRVIQGLVAGVGFLCAGTILKDKAGDQVHGLTTAAGLWLTAAIGMACGLGREITALIATLMAIVVFSVVPRFLGSDGKGDGGTDGDGSADASAPSRPRQATLPPPAAAGPDESVAATPASRPADRRRT